MCVEYFEVKVNVLFQLQKKHGKSFDLFCANTEYLYLFERHITNDICIICVVSTQSTLVSFV